MDVDGVQEEIRLLEGTGDRYGGVEVNLTESMTTESFVLSLRASLAAWREQRKKGIWIKMSSELDHLVEPAKRQGFEYHHAERGYLMLVSWIADTPSTIPANASHLASIVAFVLNDKKEVLVVQENGGFFEGTGVWKLPTGLVKEGECIWAGAVREVQKETGIETKFVELLALRECHRHGFLGNKTDILYLCELKPSTFEINKQESEILDAMWMPIKEFVEQPCHALERYKMLKQMADICWKRSNEAYSGFSTVLHSRGKTLYCSPNHANSLNQMHY